ncbi:GNAT family N-acetyltransferase [Nonomuraea sp. NPDC050556]|uniref:GNAT family N-acetyltransferase n=1 Tax=Nonomuraea sp. NPDC050556 TaxID=3364369 RepID=UPI00378EB2A9
MDRYIRNWQAGWGLCRGLDPAKEIDGGLLVTLGLPGRTHEIIVLDRRALPDLAARVATAEEPTWLTVPTQHPEEDSTTLQQAGLVPLGPPERLMTTELPTHPTAEGVTVTAEGDVLTARITVGDQIAATGMMGLAGASAVAHAIRTDPEHQRRGHGTRIMAALAAEAVARGAKTGLLIASHEGEQLYTALGWTPLAAVLTSRVAA